MFIFLLFLTVLGFITMGWRLLVFVGFGYLVYFIYMIFLHEKVIEIAIKVGDFIDDLLP